MTIHLVHGWSEQDQGMGTVGSLEQDLAATGLPRQYHGHDWPRLKPCALLAQRQRTKAVADEVAQALEDGDSIVAFSNGNPVARRALEQSGKLIHTWIAIAPALPEDAEIPLNVKQVVVMHSDQDRAVVLGQVWAWVNPAAWILGHDWGWMGRTGYTGGDNRVVNWPSRMGVRHSGWFDPEPLQFWGPRIADALIEAR